MTETSRDLPPSARHILLFGGTFDPVHRAHTAAAIAARDLAMPPDAWLVFVPAARSPFKEAVPGAPDSARFDMLSLALRDHARTAISDFELSRPAPSWWIDTVRHFRAAIPAAADLRFLIGADAAPAFRRWRDWREILRLARPVIMARPPITTADALADALRAEGSWSEGDIDAWRARFIAGAVIDISATEIRAALAAGAPRAVQFLDPAVHAYIKHHHLYRAP